MMSRKLTLVSRRQAVLLLCRGAGSITADGLSQELQATPATNADHAKLSGSASTSEFCPRDFRFVFPDFLPQRHFDWRNPITEKLERLDMLRRRAHIDIPEFYVGSVLAVTASDEYAQGGATRFLGICIERDRSGLRHHFTLRNCIDGLGVEVRFDMYNPLLRKIEVLKLEKRLDDHLLYLRDALPEYSTFLLDMQPVPHASGAPVRVNAEKVKLRPPPWTMRWELRDVKGVDNMWSLVFAWNKKRFSRTQGPHMASFAKYDYIRDYRTEIPREDEEQVFQEMVHYDRNSVVLEKSGKKRPLFRHRNRTPTS